MPRSIRIVPSAANSPVPTMGKVVLYYFSITVKSPQFERGRFIVRRKGRDERANRHQRHYRWPPNTGSGYSCAASWSVPVYTSCTVPQVVEYTPQKRGSKRRQTQCVEGHELSGRTIEDLLGVRSHSVTRSLREIEAPCVLLAEVPYLIESFEN